MPKTKTGLFLLSLVASLLWAGATPSHAAGEAWRIDGVNTVGCASRAWNVAATFSGLESSPLDYVAHTTVTVGGLVYMNEEARATDTPTSWMLYDKFDYGSVPNRGTWPMPAGQQMTVHFTLERPKGTVLSSWTMIASSCDSDRLLYNAADLDQDTVADGYDGCPRLAAATASGCPLRDRTLTLKARSGPRRVVGRLHAVGHPELYAGQKVTIWKARPGPDRKVATRTVNSSGTFKARLPRGRYYATAPGLVVSTAGEATADRSGRARVR